MPFRKKETYEDVYNFGFACLLNGGRRIGLNKFPCWGCFG